MSTPSPGVRPWTLSVKAVCRSPPPGLMLAVASASVRAAARNGAVSAISAAATTNRRTICGRSCMPLLLLASAGLTACAERGGQECQSSRAVRRQVELQRSFERQPAHLLALEAPHRLHTVILRPKDGVLDQHAVALEPLAEQREQFTGAVAGLLEQLTHGDLVWGFASLAGATGNGPPARLRNTGLVVAKLQQHGAVLPDQQRRGGVARGDGLSHRRCRLRGGGGGTLRGPARARKRWAGPPPRRRVAPPPLPRPAPRQRPAGGGYSAVRRHSVTRPRPPAHRSARSPGQARPSSGPGRRADRRGAPARPGSWGSATR